MNRFIPAQAETREFAAAAVVAYCYDGAKGPAFLAYKGRKAKPSRQYAFATAARRDEGLAFYIEQETRAEDERHARHEAGHGLAVGDIVYAP